MSEAWVRGHETRRHSAVSRARENLRSISDNGAHRRDSWTLAKAVGIGPTPLQKNCLQGRGAPSIEISTS